MKAGAKCLVAKHIFKCTMHLYTNYMNRDMRYCDKLKSFFFFSQHTDMYICNMYIYTFLHNIYMYINSAIYYINATEKRGKNKSANDSSQILFGKGF